MEIENNNKSIIVDKLSTNFKRDLEDTLGFQCIVNVFILDYKLLSIDVLYNIVSDLLIEQWGNSAKFKNDKINLNYKTYKTSRIEIVAYRQLFCYISKKYLKLSSDKVISSKIGQDRSLVWSSISKVEDMISTGDSLYMNIYQDILDKMKKYSKTTNYEKTV